jgi:hypothetical protein
MDQGRRVSDEEIGAQASVHGVVLGLLIAIPFWVCIAVAGILLLQDGPITEAESAALMIAAGVEAVLLRHAWRTYRPKVRIREPLARAALAAWRSPTLKQTALLGGLVGAYLQYYFWDVQLQIASLNRVTVFI